MAITADKMNKYKKLDEAVYETHVIQPGATVYVGGLANFNATGSLQNAADAASQRFAGEVYKIVNESGDPITTGTGNTALTVKAEIRYGHQVLCNIAAPARDHLYLGQTVSVSDNETVGLSGTNSVNVGQLASFGSSTSTGYIWLRRNGNKEAI